MFTYSIESKENQEAVVCSSCYMVSISMVSLNENIGSFLSLVDKKLLTLCNRVATTRVF